MMGWDSIKGQGFPTCKVNTRSRLTSTVLEENPLVKEPGKLYGLTLWQIFKRNVLNSFFYLHYKLVLNCELN